MAGRRASLLCALLLTAALLYVLPGLIGSAALDDNRMDTRLRPAKARTLTVWLMPGGVEDKRLLNEICAAFEDEHRGVRVFMRAVTAEEWTAPDAVLPDVALIATGSLNTPETVFIPLTGAEDAGSSGQSGGTAYAVPLWLEASVLSLPAGWLSDTPEATPAPSPLFELGSPAPQAEKATAGTLAVEDLPWRRLLAPGALKLPKGAALQQLMFVCPPRLRGELSALGREAVAPAAESQARVCTLGEHLAAVRGGAALAACPLLPAVSDRVRYAALCRDGQDARAFLSYLTAGDQQERAAAFDLVPALERVEVGDAVARAVLERFADGMVLPNAFSHTAQERESLCQDAFLRAADPVETLLRLR